MISEVGFHFPLEIINGKVPPVCHTKSTDRRKTPPAKTPEKWASVAAPLQEPKRPARQDPYIVNIELQRVDRRSAHMRLGDEPASSRFGIYSMLKAIAMSRA